MKRYVTQVSALALSVLLIACGAEYAEEAMADTPDTEPTPAVATQEALSCTLMGATLEEAEARPSPLRQVNFTYDGGEGLLCYGAPSARGRDIMGGLVPFGQPWRGGANEPTTLHVSSATSIGGVALEAGSYSMYTIPGESEWEFFLNTNYQRWGIPISADVRGTEIGSFTVTPSTTDEMVETLTYEHMEGHFMMTWENTHLHIPFGG